jgi:hypothetical protein
VPINQGWRATTRIAPTSTPYGYLDHFPKVISGSQLEIDAA